VACRRIILWAITSTRYTSRGITTRLSASASSWRRFCCSLRTALLGAIVYFPIILNICVLAYAVRFEGTRITTLVLLANLFLLVWDYDRLKHLVPLGGTDGERPVLDKTSKFPVWFFALVFAAVVSVILINAFLYDVRRGNSPLECTNACKTNGNPSANSSVSEAPQARAICAALAGRGRQISLLLDRQNQRLITKTLQLTAELARLCGARRGSGGAARSYCRGQLVVGPGRAAG
jgi:hypothetical protein